MTAQQQADLLKRRIEASPSASLWLKKALVTAEGRDPVDALNDAEFLVEYCRLRNGETS